ncbi:MAG: helix-hairpin-helix domain-containing protein [Haloarculaceae archaeon]
MGLLEKLKSIFGSGDERQSSSETGQPDVTVEHEPSAESEHAVKGTGPSETSEVAESDDRDGPDGGPGADSPSVEEIRGIGPTYSSRLSEIGIETVADLAAADPEKVAEAAGTSPSRADGWIERARDR